MASGIFKDVRRNNHVCWKQHFIQCRDIKGNIHESGSYFPLQELSLFVCFVLSGKLGRMS